MFIVLLCVFLFLCGCCVCNVFRCSGVQVVVVCLLDVCPVMILFLCVCCDSVEGVGCVLHVVIVCSGGCFVIVCAYVQRVKIGVFTPQRIYIKKVHCFLKIIVVFLAYMKKKMYLCSVKMKE